MIYPVTMFSAKCDNCAAQWTNEDNSWVALTDESSLKSSLDDDEWHTVYSKGEPDKHYCPKCFSIDDDGKLVLIPLKIPA